MAVDSAAGVGELVLDELQLRYRRVQESLAEEIRRGGRPSGSLLPPERALAEHFGVSRATLRRALTELEGTGLIARNGPRGWAVAGSRIGEPPNVLMSFSEMSRSRGLRPGAAMISSGLRPATIDEADSLGLAPGAQLFELERLRSMDDVPIMIDRTRIPTALAPGLDQEDFTTMSLYAFLEERCGIRPTRARLSAEAVGATDRQARLLDLRPGEPLLRCNQVTTDQLGRRIELCEMTYRGDRYRFRATLQRDDARQDPGSASGPVT
jgi:GntR family transcriptional regulator